MEAVMIKKQVDGALSEEVSRENVSALALRELTSLELGLVGGGVGTVLLS